MTRPTTIEVDLALMISKLDSPTASNAAKLLALEVLALREEREKMLCANMEEASDQVRYFRAENAKLRDELALANTELYVALEQVSGEPGPAGGLLLATQAENAKLRKELASQNAEVKRIFTQELNAELHERTAECDKLRGELANRDHRIAGMKASGDGWERICKDLRATIARVEALCDELETPPHNTVSGDYARRVRAALRDGREDITLASEHEAENSRMQKSIDLYRATIARDDAKLRELREAASLLHTHAARDPRFSKLQATADVGAVLAKLGST